MDAEKTINAIPFAEAGQKNWYLSAKQEKQNRTLSIKLNNGKKHDYLANVKTDVGDQVIIDHGGESSYQMGSVELIAKGLKVKRDYALQPLFTFSINPGKTDIDENAEGIKGLDHVEDVSGYFDFMGNEGRFRIVDHLVQGVLNAITVLAYPQLAAANDVAKAKAFLAEEKPVPGLIFGEEFHGQYYDSDECAEAAFTGFYPGWQDEMKQTDFFQDSTFIKLQQDMDIEFEDHVVFFYFDGDDEHERFFSDCKDFRSFTNELVFRSALSILIRGGFVNLLRAALSVKMPINAFYDKLIAFANDIGSTECAKLLESIDYTIQNRR